MTSPQRRHQPGRIGRGQILGAGLIDSTGLALGWTVFLLVVTRERGLTQAALLTSATLIGMALSAPFSAWLAPRVSPRHLLQWLAVAEGAGRLSLFVLLWKDASTLAMGPVVVVVNVLAWTAYAAMRSEISRADGGTDAGRWLTLYSAGIAASEAIAAGGASLLIARPSALIMLVICAVYTMSLLPQWWAGSRADPARHRESARLLRIAPLLAPCAVGAGVFLIAGGPALLATALAFELHGSFGVVVSTVAFTAGSLGSARLQSLVARSSSMSAAVSLLGAAMAGCWAISDRGLIALALAQVCVGLTQCCIEGDLDARAVARVPPHAATAALACAASCRALGGAAAVAVLPALITHTSLTAISLAAAGLLAAIGLVATALGRRPLEGRSLRAAADLGLAALAQSLHRRARNAVVRAEQPRNGLLIGESGIGQHGERAAQFLKRSAVLD